MQHCNYASRIICNSAPLHVCIFADMHSCTCALLHLCTNAMHRLPPPCPTDEKATNLRRFVMTLSGELGYPLDRGYIMVERTNRTEKLDLRLTRAAKQTLQAAAS